ncbi:hypothetical protein V5O48_010741 [Marasmius crinis-equi]|uniref:Peptidase A2 domain-containing protein n=1 Tax=Marasmius crinis-equi TaxID=585013 RepID=A0ABR3F7U6_9AGAR
MNGHMNITAPTYNTRPFYEQRARPSVVESRDSGRAASPIALPEPDRDTYVAQPNHNHEGGPSIRVDASPVKVIKAAFEDAFAGDLKFNGDFAYFKLFDSGADASLNPCLRLKGLGSIGLPLNELQIDAIKKCCYADGVTGENVWHFPGHDIEFRNPAWNTWFDDKMVAPLKKALGVSASPTTAIFDRLTIRGPQTEYDLISIPKKLQNLIFLIDRGQQDSANERFLHPRQFASFSVILPSPHTGGDMVFNCRDEAIEVFHTADHSEISTMLVGGYSSIGRVRKPIGSGYVVSLDYALVCLSDGPVPCLPTFKLATYVLSNAFYLWRQAVDNCPPRANSEEGYAETSAAPDILMCLLKRKCKSSSSGLQTTLLHFLDRRIIALMEPLARMYGFDLHLARPKFKQTAQLGEGSKRYNDSDDESTAGSEDLNPDHYTMPDSEETECCIKLGKEVYTLDGQPVKMNGPLIESIEQIVDFDDHQWLFINGSVLEAECSQHCVGYDDGIGLTYTWKSKAMIITPSRNPSLGITFESLETNGTKKRSGEADSTSFSNAKKPRVC